MTIASLLTVVGPIVPQPQAPPGLDGFAYQFLGWLKWGGLVAALAGLSVCAIAMMIGRRNPPGGRRLLRADSELVSPWAATGGRRLRSAQPGPGRRPRPIGRVSLSRPIKPT